MKNLLYGWGPLHILDLDSRSLTNIGSPFVFSRSDGCVWNGYVWGNFSNGAGAQWGRKHVNNEPVFEPLPLPEVIEAYPGTDPANRMLTFFAPTSDRKHLVVGGKNAVVLLRFE